LYHNAREDAFLKTIDEAERKTPVTEEVDVIVAGGGPAGVAAAVSAARNGAKTILVERYGHLGGLATGGLVICLVETGRYGFGMCREVIERLLEHKAGRINEPTDKPGIWIEGASLSGAETCSFDPEILKYIFSEMVSESGVNLLLHSLIVGSVIDNGKVQGLIIEGKSGRQAVLGKVVVDATGDGDVAALSGAPFNIDRHPWGINLEFRIGNVNVEKALKWREDNPELYDKLMKKLEAEIGKVGWGRTIYENVAWGHGPHFYDVDGLNVKDLTRVEVESRRQIVAAVKFFKKHIPGFEEAFIIDIAPQIGVRETRRIIGEYILTKEDEITGRDFDDNIARGIFGIPYRCLIPKKVEGLLVAGRCISTTHEAHGAIRNIPPCMITGQAAGTAAALSVKEKVSPRELDINLLKETLRKQGVRL